MDLMAGALVRLGCRRALVVSGEDGMDEVSIIGETKVVEVTPDGIRSYTVVPEQVGLTRADADEAAGGTPERCVEIVRELLDGASGHAARSRSSTPGSRVARRGQGVRHRGGRTAAGADHRSRRRPRGDGPFRRQDRRARTSDGETVVATTLRDITDAVRDDLER